MTEWKGLTRERGLRAQAHLLLPLLRQSTASWWCSSTNGERSRQRFDLKSMQSVTMPTSAARGQSHLHRCRPRETATSATVRHCRRLLRRGHPQQQRVTPQGRHLLCAPLTTLINGVCGHALGQNALSHARARRVGRPCQCLRKSPGCRVHCRGHGPVRAHAHARTHVR
jgi:hypothetical protein